MQRSAPTLSLLASLSLGACAQEADDPSVELGDGQRVGYVLVGDQIEALAVSDHEDGVLALGDVMLPYEAVFDTREEAEEAQRDETSEGFRAHGLVYFSDVPDPTWPRVASGPEAGSLRIPYVISDELTPAQHERVLAAMAYWRHVAPVVFSPRSNQADYIAIEIDDDLGCAAFIGNVGGRRRLTVPSSSRPNDPVFRRLDDNCILHELGHTIGFFHEQSRLDRDDFVELRTANIEVGQERNFFFRGNGIGLGPYDLTSIMQYGSQSWTTNGRPTIVRKNGGQIGLPERLSAGDIDGAARQIDPWARAEWCESREARDVLSAGGWSDPFDICDCVAPLLNCVVAGPSDTVIEGTAGPDYIIGNARDNVIRGRGGDDVIVGGGGDDELVGGAGNDWLRGLEDNDTLRGGPGNDRLDDASGNNVGYGGDGHDELRVRGTAHGQDGHDILWALRAGDSAFGGNGNDLFGGRAAIIDGGTGRNYAASDAVQSAASATSVPPGRINQMMVCYEHGAYRVLLDGARGTSAHECIFGTSGDDILRGGGGNDVIWGQAGNDLIFGEAGADLLMGGADNDDLRGGEGHDDLRGSGGRDTLSGGLGNDALYGGAGHDVVHGGQGHDLFFSATDDELIGGPGHDKLVTGIPASCSSVNSGSNGASRCP